MAGFKLPTSIFDAFQEYSDDYQTECNRHHGDYDGHELGSFLAGIDDEVGFYKPQPTLADYGRWQRDNVTKKIAI